jgi:hypothetical protein
MKKVTLWYHRTISGLHKKLYSDTLKDTLRCVLSILYVCYSEFTRNQRKRITKAVNITTVQYTPSKKNIKNH